MSSKQERNWSELVSDYKGVDLSESKASLLYAFSGADLKSNSDELERFKFFWGKAKKEDGRISKKAKKELFSKLFYSRDWLFEDGGWEILQEVFKAIIILKEEGSDNELPQVAELLRKKDEFRLPFKGFLESYWDCLIHPSLEEKKDITFPWTQIEDKLEHHHVIQFVDVLITLNYLSFIERCVADNMAVARLEKFLGLKNLEMYSSYNLALHFAELIDNERQLERLKTWAKIKRRIQKRKKAK